MLNIPDIRMEKFTGSLEKLNITILVISLIASLLAQVWGSYKPMLNDKKRWPLCSVMLDSISNQNIQKSYRKRLEQEKYVFVSIFILILALYTV